MTIDFLFRKSSDHNLRVHWRKYYQTEKKTKGRVGLAAPGILRGTAGFHIFVFLFLNLGSARAELAFQESQSNTGTKCLPRKHYNIARFPESCSCHCPLLLREKKNKIAGILTITITPLMPDP